MPRTTESKKKKGRNQSPLQEKKISFTPLHEGTTQHFNINFPVKVCLDFSVSANAVMRSTIGLIIFQWIFARQNNFNDIVLAFLPCLN